MPEEKKERTMVGPACSLEVRPRRTKIPAPMIAPRRNQRRSHHETIFESGFGFLESFEVIALALEGFLWEEIVLAAPPESTTINGGAVSFSGSYHGRCKSEEPLAPPPSLFSGSSSGSMPTPFPGFAPSSIDDGAALLNSRRLPLWDAPSARQRNGGPPGRSARAWMRVASLQWSSVHPGFKDTTPLGDLFPLNNTVRLKYFGKQIVEGVVSSCRLLEKV
ncbi:hypothetical protein NE237_018523 [Protea cynaroides]|uniref:Uncharacterized protein n=1 Tax=Protea cynaroides TaxID=273540 RepID=A0A9Q0QP95_9MAGN|nr:hypothetical protein NE237_018523 [Protea cynaroides]